jgi:hypothetical protein
LKTNTPYTPAFTFPHRWILKPLENATRIAEALPPLPRTLSEAFALGRLSGSISSSSADSSTALTEAARILGWSRPISREQLAAIADTIARSEQRVSLFSQVRAARLVGD